MSCTHTHSAPDANADGSDLSTWKGLVYSAVREAGKAAMDNRDKSEMYIGSTNVQGLNFVRRYVLADGTYLGDNSGNTSTAPIVGHETDADTQLQILKFDRENEKDIILANFQAHPTMTGGSTKYEVSADYPGAFRKAVEKDLDVEFAFFQGAAGNLNPNSRIQEEKHDKDYVAYGRVLADALIAKLPELEKVETGKVRTMTKSVDCTVNHSTDSKVETARIVAAAFSSNDSQKTAALCAQYGFSSGFAANAVINRSSMPETIPVDIYAVSIGDVAFVGSSYEMFDTSGMEIKAASPYKMTFICEQTNSTNGYMPSALAFEHAGYEVDICKFVSGTAENLVQEYLNMLNTMHTA